MKKVIVVDATWLKTKYRGNFLIANAQDSDRQCYLIAWAIVDLENDASWTWFFTKLKEIVPDSDELAFVSDRHESINKAVCTIYEKAHHRACTWHVGQNMKSHFKSIGAFNLYYEASNAYTLSTFNSKFKEMERRFPSVARYLKEIVGFELWAQAHFPGKRYNIMTSNIAESLNSMFKKAREFHVVALLDAIQAKMSSWFNDWRKIAAGIKSPLTPLMEEKVRERWNEAKTF
ncbi:hypothetical protein UlMin_024446 [Ulmus minor]